MSIINNGRYHSLSNCVRAGRPDGYDAGEYKRVERAFQRLQGTQFKTNIRTGNKKEVRIFSLVDEGGYVMRQEGEWRLDYCEIVLSDWFIRAIESNEVISISEDYFRLRRPLERRIFEIARKHCGNQKQWHIGLAKLQEKTGSNAALKRFRLNIREIIKEDHTPFYRIELTDDHLVIFRPRTKKETSRQNITPHEWAEDKARKITRDKGWDYYALRGKWMDFAAASIAKGDPPKDAGAAFVAYCPVPDDHIDPRRSALFMARSVLEELRDGGTDACSTA